MTSLFSLLGPAPSLQILDTQLLMYQGIYVPTYLFTNVFGYTCTKVFEYTIYMYQGIRIFMYQSIRLY